jgi:uncharacterized damage-inducible protein DinB
MNLQAACLGILAQLTELVKQLSEQDYCKPIPTLSQSSIGQHLRHTLEFFICLEQGFAGGIINYDKRAHDKLIESDKFIALSVLSRIKNFVEQQRKNCALKLEVGYDLVKEDFVTVETNYQRELIYNIEHAVHHMAIIKIGVREVAPYVSLPHNFGVAASTIRYQETTPAPQA